MSCRAVDCQRGGFAELSEATSLALRAKVWYNYYPKMNVVTKPLACFRPRHSKPRS